VGRGAGPRGRRGGEDWARYSDGSWFLVPGAAGVGLSLGSWIRVNAINADQIDTPLLLQVCMGEGGQSWGVGRGQWRCTVAGIWLRLVPAHSRCRCPEVHYPKVWTPSQKFEPATINWCNRYHPLSPAFEGDESSVYFFAEPRASSTGYFSEFSFSFARITAAGSNPQA
jgi:hypothetical protein